MALHSIEMLLQRLVDISNQAYDVILEVEQNSGISRFKQDARYVALDTIQQITMACVKWISSDLELQKYVHKEFGDQWSSKYLDLINGGCNLDIAQTQMMDLLRSSYSTKIHFSIENLFSNLLKSKKPNYNQTGFYNIFTDILKACNLPRNGIERQTACALANIRNSFHTNGIHTQESMDITFNDVRFEFTQGKPLMCSSWDHLTTIASVNIELIRAILTNQAFRSIEGLIIDKYASSLET